jgi:outer membrane protein TolC
VRLALESSPNLEALESLREAADYDIEAARAARLPAVDGMAGYTRRSSVPELTIPLDGVERTIFPNIQNNWTARVEATMPLYTGGRTEGAIDAAEGRREAAVGDVAAGRADVALETRRTYWSLVTAIETERVLRAALGAYDAHLVDARNRERFGVAARDEVLAVQVQRERGELARLQADNFVETLRADLIRLLGLEPGTVVVPGEPLVGAEEPPSDVDALVTRAMEQRPERSALRARITAGEAAERTQRAARLPHIGVAAGYDYARPNRLIIPPEDQWDGTWDVSVRISMRLFDAGQTRAVAAATAARTDALRRRLDDLDRRIRSDVTARVLDVRNAIRSVDVARANVASAEENLRISRDRYREGVIPSSELLDAETALLNAELDRTRALAAVRQTRADLDRAIGE